MLVFFGIIIISVVVFAIFGDESKETYNSDTDCFSCPMCGKVYSNLEESDLCYNDCCAFDDELNEMYED